MRVTIDRLGHQGDGIAPGPVYVPRALPGELFEGKVEGDRMSDPQIVTSSSERVTPSCPHYDTCGGCALLHASDSFVAEWKIGVVREALRARDLPAPIKGIATSPPASRRRASLSGRRTKNGALVGFHGRRSGTITEITGCQVLAPEILAALPVLTELTEAAASRKGELSLLVTSGPAGLDVAMAGAKASDAALLTRLAEIAGHADLARLTLDGEPVIEARSPRQVIGGMTIVPPPGAFLQATSHGESALIACVAQALGDGGPVIDLFAGCGTFAVPLSRRAPVHAVEGNAEMLRAAARAGSGRVTTERRDLFRDPVEAAHLSDYAAAVIDPPRAGAEAQCRELAESTLQRIAFVSCNPVTFARDAGSLIRGGYRLDWVRVIDQFRWSPHVEIAAAFSRQ
ncbi:class I SAM-dependent RNA methyltransferase [Palleronia caenipelagi]|uniref:Class I SAM-dependent RNA methyltransferase n=1 Tax=Palleronia caenipelagi TaxID=2489174 RepID=A0A547Q6H7_9RHOB|nr:class I SAM-dependent RNA methyltransferase [Palleronia caenipelagi]TRD21979.1 class I SAM-dependent RNA methyltransferase [Palleronia caenipelagi]